MPLWVCYQHNFYPVQTGLYPSLVHNLIYERPVVPQEEISEFLDRVWTRLPSSELYEPQQFLRMMEPVFQPATYNPKLFLDEEGSLLTLEIDNIYQTRHGEFTLNGPNPDFQTGSYTYEGQTYLVRRHQEEEAQLMNELAGMDFQARSSKLWFLEPEEAIAFLLDSYPTLVENYRVYGERALSRYKMRTAKSSISAEVVSNEKEKWFSLEISVDYEGQSLPLDKIWKAWTRGKRYVQLKDGSYTSLPESWLEKIAHKLTALGLDPSKPPQTKFKQFEAPVLDSLLEDLPGARTDSFWNNLREKIRSFREVRPVPPPKALQGMPLIDDSLDASLGPVLPQLPVGIRLRRHPGRRDGPGQDRADPGLHPAYGGKPLRGPQPYRGAHLGAAQLGARSGKVRARPAPPDHLRHAPRGHVQAYRGIGPHHHHLRPAAA